MVITALLHGGMVELADTADLKSVAETQSMGSNPITATNVSLAQ